MHKAFATLTMKSSSKSTPKKVPVTPSKKAAVEVPSSISSAASSIAKVIEPEVKLL